MNIDLCFLCSTDGLDRIPMVDLLPGQWAMGRTRNTLDGLTVKFGYETFTITSLQSTMSLVPYEDCHTSLGNSIDDRRVGLYIHRKHFD
jgi:hypothetical protein